MKTYTRIVAISFAVASRNGLVVAAQQDAERAGVSHPLLRGDQGGIDGELSAALENSERGLQSCSQSGGYCYDYTDCCGEELDCVKSVCRKFIPGVSIPGGIGISKVAINQKNKIVSANNDCLGELCLVNEDCCGRSECFAGRCVITEADQNGGIFQACSALGDSCDVTSDCCVALTCDGLECQAGNRQCGADGDSCQVAGDCCSGTCDGGVCGGDDDPGGRCGEDGDSCQDDLDCCSNVCDGGACGGDDGGQCGEIFDSCQIDLDCCSGLQCDGGECRAGSVPGGDGGFGCSLAGEYCEDDGECCEDDIEFLVCFARECRPFTSSTNACAGRGDFCIDDFDCCGGGSSGGLICALDNSCQRAISNERCSASAGSHCSGNEDCCGRDLQCGPNKRCSRIYTGVGYP